MTVYLLPVILIAAFVCALIKRVNVYDCFLDGAKESLSLAVSIFPYLAAVFVCIGLFRASGLAGIVSGWLSRPMSAVGIPPEISELVLLVPLSGNGAIAALEDIIARYGADSRRRFSTFRRFISQNARLNAFIMQFPSRCSPPFSAW